MESLNNFLSNDDFKLVALNKSAVGHFTLEVTFYGKSRAYVEHVGSKRQPQAGPPIMCITGDSRYWYTETNAEAARAGNLMIADRIGRGFIGR